MRRCLSLLAIVLASTAHAAPAPVHRAEPGPHPVQLSGVLPDAGLAAGAPSVIVSRADYLSVARAWGITNPPAVDFRTHFVAAHAGYASVRFELDGRGDLRMVPLPVAIKCGLGMSRVAGPRYQIQSFPR